MVNYTHAQFQCLRFENGFHQYRTFTEDMTENDSFSDLVEDLYNLDRNFNELVNTGGNWENDGRVRSTRNIGMRQRNLPIGLNLTLIKLIIGVNGIL